MNKRGNPCLLCLPWVGRVLIDDVWSGGTADEAKKMGYPLMSTAISAGLYHPNCRDSHTTYFEGISSPPSRKWTKKELEEIERNAKNESKKNHAKRQAERFGRLEKFSLDEENRRKYKARAEEWEDRFSEYSLRTKSGGNYGIDWSIVKSKEYTTRFMELSDNVKANMLAAQRSRNALANRNNKTTEEIYAISLTTGKDISSITDQHHPFGVRKTEKFIRDVARAEDNNEQILLIHNHPQGLTPSPTDLNELLSHKNAVGITAGHNGTIYYYTKPSREITKTDFLIAFKKNKMYNGIKQYEKAMEELAKHFDFEFKIL